MDQDETWQGDRPRPWPHCVRRGPSSPSPKGHSPLQFSAKACCETARWIKMPLGTEVGLGPGHTVLDGDPAPQPNGGTAPPPIFAHVCCGQPAGWRKMPAGREVGLGQGDIALDEDRAPKLTQPLIFDPCLLWQKTPGWIKMPLVRR